MANATVYDLDIDGAALDKAWEHGITAEQLASLLDNLFVVRRNRKHRRAPYILIGRDHSGQCIAAPIEATDDPTTWRVVTAWYCKDNEAARLPRQL
jgi:hypothetical protein